MRVIEGIARRFSEAKVSPPIDLLRVNTERYDSKTSKISYYNVIKFTISHCEHKHLPQRVQAESIRHFKACGYCLAAVRTKTFAYFKKGIRRA